MLPRAHIIRSVVAPVGTVVGIARHSDDGVVFRGLSKVSGAAWTTTKARDQDEGNIGLDRYSQVCRAAPSGPRIQLKQFSSRRQCRPPRDHVGQCGMDQHPGMSSRSSVRMHRSVSLLLFDTLGLQLSWNRAQFLIFLSLRRLEGCMNSPEITLVHGPARLQLRSGITQCSNVMAIFGCEALRLLHAFGEVPGLRDDSYDRRCNRHYGDEGLRPNAMELSGFTRWEPWAGAR